MTTETNREERLLRAFVTLADTLVAGYDVVDLLQGLVERCIELLDATDAGILLVGGDGRLEVVASSDERSQLIELLQLNSDAGPCVECYRTGKPVSLPEIDTGADQWPSFRDQSLAQGIHAVHAVPLRLRETTIGSLNLFHEKRGELSEFDLNAAQALADVATIGILQERTIQESEQVRQQLQHALDSRVVIEQAKGVVSYLNRISVSDAFALIRSYARSQRLGIGLVAEDIVARRLTLSPHPVDNA